MYVHIVSTICYHLFYWRIGVSCSFIMLILHLGWGQTLDTVWRCSMVQTMVLTLHTKHFSLSQIMNLDSGSLHLFYFWSKHRLLCCCASEFIGKLHLFMKSNEAEVFETNAKMMCKVMNLYIMYYVLLKYVLMLWVWIS